MSNVFSSSSFLAHILLKNWDILENDLMSELQYLIYYSQCNFFIKYIFNPIIIF